MPLQNEDITKTSQEISGLLFCVFWGFFKSILLKEKTIGEVSSIGRLLVPLFSDWQQLQFTSSML